MKESGEFDSGGQLVPYHDRNGLLRCCNTGHYCNAKDNFTRIQGMLRHWRTFQTGTVNDTDRLKEVLGLVNKISDISNKPKVGDIIASSTDTVSTQSLGTDTVSTQNLGTDTVSTQSLGTTTRATPSVDEVDGNLTNGSEKAAELIPSFNQTKVDEVVNATNITSRES
ncbi:hypothetical protein AB6A40_011315 [Gnathostoma spinigerum]|uniref:Uncharacterized protein n=1 Tax=Gnathostoma spinigerum TaxID=75299 RepID=A0ABD6EXG4_9BILA